MSCDLGQKTQSREVADFIVSLTQKPTQLMIGEPAEFYVTLRKNRSGLTGCLVRYYTYPLPPQAMIASPDNFKTIPERGQSGVYSVKGSFFDASGEWEMDLELGCEDAKYHIRFPLAVAAKTNLGM